MKGDGNSKEKLPILNLMVLEILARHSDEAHQLRQTDILRILKEDYGMICDRRHVPDRLRQLMMFGFDIRKVRHGGAYTSYYMGPGGIGSFAKKDAESSAVRIPAAEPVPMKEKKTAAGAKDNSGTEGTTAGNVEARKEEKKAGSDKDLKKFRDPEEEKEHKKKKKGKKDKDKKKKDKGKNGKKHKDKD